LKWTFKQSTGELFNPEGQVIARGYSGFGPGKNNPAAQTERNIGPLPQGDYLIGSAYDSQTHGPYVLPLISDPKNEMFGRSAFLIHGDSKENPGQASHGCIILTRMIRVLIGTSNVRELQVIA